MSSLFLNLKTTLVYNSDPHCVLFSVFTWPCIQVENISICHLNLLMGLETFLKESLVGHVIEDQLAELVRITDHVLQVRHGQVHESLICGGKYCPGAS